MIKKILPFIALSFICTLQTEAKIIDSEKPQLLMVLSKSEIKKILKKINHSTEIPYLQEKWSEQTRSFGNSSIDKPLFDYILKTLPKGHTLLELGSGWASGEFSKHYIVYSIEHDKRWLNKYNTHYIYAPIVGRWFDPEILKKELPEHYDLILVDGPPGYGGSTDRLGFYPNLHLFKTDVPIIFDDVNRKAEYTLMMQVANELERDVAIYQSSRSKKFGVVLLD